ncbi:MAG: alpha/beta hydrolase, partial [Elusimicrobia bacterium]|nr:alpha/beta hydrolase [Elusimicrobiota bacterium]
LGAAVAIVGAVQHPEVLAVAAESPFASYQETVIRTGKLFYGFPRSVVLSAIYCARWRLGFNPEDYAPIHHVSQLAPRPLLLIHGARDLRVSMTEIQALYDVARDPKTLWVVPDADHGEPAFRAPAEYERRLLAFFEQALVW